MQYRISANAVNKPRPSRVFTAETPKNRRFMEKYICTVCGYVYDPELGDPENGIEAGTPFEELPDDWVCPECGVGKDEFEKES